MGHTGFVGQNLVKHLRNLNHDVVGLSRQECDLRQYNEVSACMQALGHVDAVFNCAANVGSVHYVTKNAASVISDNTLMALNMYNAIHEFLPKTIIVNPFSNCCYVDGSSIQEEENWLKGEVHPSVFSFGNFKRVLYYISRCYYMQHNLQSVNLMFPGIYGPGDSTDPNKVHALNGMIIRMLGSVQNNDAEFEIWGTGKPVREWIYIEDVCNIMLDSLELGESIIDPVNIAQGKGFAIAETAGCIASSIGYRGNLTFNTAYQDGAAVKILGNKNFVQVFKDYEFFDHQKGIDRTVEYYKEVL